MVVVHCDHSCCQVSSIEDKRSDLEMIVDHLFLKDCIGRWTASESWSMEMPWKLDGSCSYVTEFCIFWNNKWGLENFDGGVDRGSTLDSTCNLMTGLERKTPVAVCSAVFQIMFCVSCVFDESVEIKILP